MLLVASNGRSFGFSGKEYFVTHFLITSFFNDIIISRFDADNINYKL